ncbi:MAG: hypothetical protein KJ626_12180 [Verrucomicrobia bacterium]|nr:hypothetical protein [Verrucomicrobiota bacterium]
MRKVRKRGSFTLGQALYPLVCSLLLSAPGSAIAQISHVRGESDFTVNYPSETSAYYQIWASDDLTGGVWGVSGIQLGAEDLGSWTDIDAIAQTSSRYYRVREVPLHLSEDTDVDGIDDVFELRADYLDALDTSDGSADQDGDTLDNADEYARGTGLTDVDSDNDGVDDGSEVAEESNPLDQLPTSGLNRNWLFHNNAAYSSPTWERAPGCWQRFLICDYDSGTNTVYFLAPTNIVLDSNGTLEVECRVSWPRQSPETGWLTQWYQADPVPVASTSFDSIDAFHGLPTMGGATLNVYRVSWPQPPYTNSELPIYYAPFVRSRVNGQQTDYTYLIDHLQEWDTPASGYATNNWRNGQQLHGSDAPGRDYMVVHSPELLMNGGFEEGNPSAVTNIPHWKAWEENSEVSSRMCRNASGRAFVSKGWDGVLFQSFGVLPGEELVLSGWLMSPAETNVLDPSPLSSSQRGRMTLEFWDSEDYLISSTNAFLASEHASDVWHYMSVTSLVPDLTASANVSLRTEGVGDGHVYFDDLRVVRSADADSDGMPDAWELGFPGSLNIAEPTDSLDDTDADGLSNIDEFRNRTSAMSSDTDSDGMSDSWELLYGLDPRVSSDAYLDADEDGLNNAQEFISGTSPSIADTDGDGLLDADEVLDLLSDPLTPDAWSYDIVDTIPASSVVSSTGQWRVEGQSLQAAGRRGLLEYEFVVSDADVCRLEIEGADGMNALDPARFILNVHIDGQFIGKLILQTEHAQVSVARIFTPWLTAGTHSLQLFWDNASDDERLRLHEIRIEALRDPDSDGDGIKDWVERLLVRQADVERVSTPPYVSPACLEGRAAYFDMASSSTGTLSRGIGEGWYCDVPLQPGTNSFTVSFQHGSRIVANSAVWSPLNVLQASNMAVRLGDSVLMTLGGEDGDAEVVLHGVTNYVGNAGDTFVHTFGAAGDFLLTGTLDSSSAEPRSHSITVTVASASFDESPACWAGYPRQWSCSNLSDEVVIGSDPRCRVVESENEISEGRQFELDVPENQTYYMLARLGENGPVMANVALRGFHILAESQTYLRFEDTLEDGTEVIGMLVVASPLLPDLDFNLEIFVSGVFLDDGTLVREFSAHQFDEVGEYVVHFLRNPDTLTSVCHRLEAIQNLTILGAR